MPPFPRSLPVLVLALALGGCQAPAPAALGTLSAGFVLPMQADEPVAVKPAGRSPSSPPGSGTSGAPAAVPTPPPTGGAGGGTPAAPAPGGLTGQVIGLAGAAERPLDGATVRTSDGRSTTTDASGHFTLPGGWPADGGLVASLPGYTASAVVGLDGAGPVTLHLQAQAAVETAPAAPVEAVRAVGRVVGPDGLPRGGITVVLEDAQGTSSAPVITGADGAFELKVFAPAGQVTDGTVLAVGPGPDAWMGMAMHVTLDATHPDLDLDAGAVGNSPLVVRAATHPLTLAIDASAAGAIADLSLELVGPGASLSVPLDGQTGWVAAVAGARFDVHAEALNPTLGTMSRLRLEDVPVDVTTPETVVSAAMLAPPELTTDAELVPGSLVAWKPIAGVQGYTLSLAGLEDQGFVWEAYTPTPSMAYSYATPLAPGSYGLTIAAWDDGALSPRAVAAVGPARLRVTPLGHSYRRSSRQVRRTLS